MPPPEPEPPPWRSRCVQSRCRQHVAVLGQFHLCLGVGRLCAHGEDVEDEAGAVQDFHLQFLLDVAELLGGEFVVENHHAHLAFGVFLRHDVGTDFLQLALPDVCHRGRAVEALREPLHGHGARRFGEESQFVEVFLRLAFRLVFGDEAHEHGGLGAGLGLYEFFH